MRRLASVLACTGFSVGVVGLLATALVQPASATEVSGRFEGTATGGSNSDCHESLVWKANYTLNGGGGSGTFHSELCLRDMSQLQGTLTLTTPSGATLNGSAYGGIDHRGRSIKGNASFDAAIRFSGHGQIHGGAELRLSVTQEIETLGGDREVISGRLSGTFQTSAPSHHSPITLPEPASSTHAGGS